MYPQYENKKIAILGLGIEGISSLRFFSKQGAQLAVRDKAEETLIDKDLLNEAKQATSDLVFGYTYLQNLIAFDYIVRTPIIRPDLPELLEAAHNGVKITSNLKTFFDLCPAKIIGVTGTKGKGTTTALIGEMLKKGGFRTFVGGNIGDPPLNFLSELGNDNWVVLEMSSFQLMDMEKSPHIAVVLMVTSEHLDWHKDSQEYIDAKVNIVSHQTEADFAVINTDHPGSSGFSDKTPAKKLFVSSHKEQSPGVYVKNQEIIRSINGKTESILPTKDIYLKGRHNVENIIAAGAASSIVGVRVKDITEISKTFKGLPHRLEFVREIAGTKFYNDSFSTTPETAIAAIGSFTEPIILILGGSDKGSDYTDLGNEINRAKNIKNLILIGNTAEKIETLIDSKGKYKDKVVKDLKTMQEIVQSARSKAKPGDVVLLSPACASFGLFRNYKDRGDQFKTVVSSMKDK